MTSQICHSLNSIKILRMCLIQKVNSIDESLWQKALDIHLQSKDWCKWSTRKVCMTTVARGSRSIGYCNGKIQIDKGQLVCLKHCQQFGETQPNMKAIQWRLSPSLLY